jgi:hypothetical protein
MMRFFEVPDAKCPTAPDGGGEEEVADDRCFVR